MFINNIINKDINSKFDIFLLSVYNKIGDFMKKCAIVCNKKSGRGIKEEDLAKILNILFEKGYEGKIYITKEEKDAIKIVEDLEDVDLILSIGGDGTFSEVIEGNLKRENKTLLAHIPIGTTNDVGNMLGMGKNIINNVKDVLDGQSKKVDICFINDHPFIYVAGFGKYITVSYDTPKEFKKAFGYFAYLFQGIIEFFKPTRLYEIEYSVNNETYKGLYSMILVSNANRIAGINDIYKDMKLDDKNFEVLFCNISKRKDLIKSFYYFKTTELNRVPGIFFHRTDKLQITFKKKIKSYWTIDGDRFEDRKKTYTFTTDNYINMLIPKKNIDKLFLK